MSYEIPREPVTIQFTCPSDEGRQTSWISSTPFTVEDELEVYTLCDALLGSESGSSHLT